MTKTVTLPLWVVVLGIVLAAWTLFFCLIWPALRSYFRRRSSRAARKLNEILDIRLPDFKLTRRRILIDRLKYDTRLRDAVRNLSRKGGMSVEEGMKLVEVYAREIVPSFNAEVYFRLGNWLGKRLGRLLYRVRVGVADEAGLTRISPDSSLVFIMNHRSNMDYILLSLLSFERVALSFAVGEWARIWPLEPLIRSMGAFFVRRDCGNTLYRRVLERYVQMATEEGVVQAVFPEGRLSRDGRPAEPKIGLLDYMLRDFDPGQGRDIVFIPVGVNYDRVLEDRTLLLDRDRSVRKRKAAVLGTTARYIGRQLWLMLRGRWHRFGYAVVNFGPPVSMRRFAAERGVDFMNLDREARIAEVKHLAAGLMQASARVIPVVPVPLVAQVLAENSGQAQSLLEIKARVQSLIDSLERGGAYVHIPRRDRDYAVEVGLRALSLRHVIREENGLFSVDERQVRLLDYYAATIEHLIPE